MTPTMQCLLDVSAAQLEYLVEVLEAGV